MTGEMIGHGTTIQMALLTAPTVFTAIVGAFGFTAPQPATDSVDVTHFQSVDRTREFIPGLTGPGSASFAMNYVPGSVSDVYMRTARGNQRVVKVTWPNGASIQFTATITGYGPDDAAVEGKLTATCNMEVSGTTTYAAAAAPLNIILPAISGQAKVGVVLTAFDGIWDSPGTFTYLWRKSAAGIPGATTNTYTPVVGDIGSVITVRVTANNSTGSTVATSANTDVVVA